MRKELLVTEERYHLYNRGAGKLDIFRDDEDRRKFIWNLHHYQDNRAGETIVRISSYVLMSNHFHLTIQQAIEPGISIFMNKVCKSYALYFNQKYGRKGCLFAGRFHAKWISNDAYFLHLIRYIHRNPVDIIGEEMLDSFPWSSHQIYLRKKHSLIITDLLAMNMFDNITEYKVFMQSWKPGEDELIQNIMIDGE